jgi:hypothetical protein
MASIVSAGTTSATALNMSADTTGVLQLASNNGTVSLTVSTDQNIQIGTTTVATPLTDVLTVAKNSTSYDASLVVRQFGNGTAAGIQLIAANDTGATYNSISSTTSGGTQHWRLGGTASAAGALPIFTSGTERMRITGSATGGVTCIRTSSPVTGFAGGGASVLTLASGGNTWGVGPTVDFGNFYIVWGGTLTGVSLNGGSTSWGTASDERIKDIIEPISNALQKVGSLRSVIGKYKTDDEGTRRSFLIAQDVLAVLPEAVSAEQDEQKTLNLRYTEVVPLLVAAINQLSAKVTSLEEQVLNLGVK